MFIKLSLQNLQSTLKALGYSRTFNIKLLASGEQKTKLLERFYKTIWLHVKEWVFKVLVHKTTWPTHCNFKILLYASTFRFENNLGLMLKNWLPCQMLIMSYLQHKLNISCKKPFFVAKNCFFRSFKTVYAILFSSLCNIFQK